MSTVGQAAGGLVGGIAGFLLGGPTGALYGAQIGLGVGGYLDPVKGPVSEGPRLSDLSVQTSTYGASVPRNYGAVAGLNNIFWLENNAIKETVTKKKSGGKGGGSKVTTRTYTYSATFAVALDDTRAKGAALFGKRRIWVGPNLFYDGGNSDPDTIAASNAAAATFAFYPGSDTQLPDPRMQAALGVSNTPAYRGLSYIVFYDLPLADYGNSLLGAQVKVEVIQSGHTVGGGTSSFSVKSFTGAIASSHRFAFLPTWGIATNAAAGESTAYWKTQDGGQTWVSASLPEAGSQACVTSDGTRILVLSRNSGSGRIKSFESNDGTSWTTVQLDTGGLGDNYGGSQKTVAGNGVAWCALSPYSAVLYVARMAVGGSSWAKVSLPTYINLAKIEVFGARFFIYSNTTTYYTSDNDGLTWVQRSLSVSGLAAATWGGGGVVHALTADGHSYIRSDDLGSTWSAPVFISASTDVWLSIGYLNSRILAVRNQYVATSVDGVTWTQAFTNYGSVSIYYVNPVPSVDRWFWYQDGLGNGYLEVTSPLADVITYADPVALSSIVSAECLQSGLLNAGDIDVSAMMQSVRGYRIGSRGSIRSALEPLRAAWPFDVVQRGYKIVFVARGGASVATIPAADLDARADGTGPGVQITTSREMDSQLPVRVSINHLDVEREYDIGTQYAERLNTPAINLLTHDLAIVLTATEAAGKAEVLLYLAWIERYDVVISLPPSWLHLEPGDVVGLTTPEGVVYLRLTGVNYTADGRVECAAKYANPAIYTPTAVGVPGQATGSATITRVGPSAYTLLDIPLVHDVQSSSGFPVAMYGTIAGWRGGVLYQSADAGATWSAVEDVGPPGATMGLASNTIGAVESRLIDKASQLTVVLSNGDLYDVTELAMLGGANNFAYGADGRWEIIAAQKCTLQSGATYILSDLLRGRYGTEQYMSTHSAGDSVILLDSDDLAIVSMSTSTIGLARDYRGVTLDQDISSASNRSFTYNAVNLKPLSPIALTGAIDPLSNDWSLSWVRRTRIGSAWRDYVDADLGESSEQYQVDIFADGSYAALKRTLSVASPGVNYTSANQVTDFGGNQSTLYIKIFQMSATVGRGYPLTTSITR